MKIKREFLRIAHVPASGYEPEQMPAQLRMQAEPAPVSLGAGPGATGNVQGHIPSTVTIESTAGDFAQQARGRCMFCRHFDRKAWLALLARKESTAAGMEEINKLRGAYFLSGNEALVDRHKSMQGDMDLEHTLKALGICQVLTEIEREPVIVYGPFGSCPEITTAGAAVKTQARPLGYFVPCDSDAEREGSAVYDSILMAAMR